MICTFQKESLTSVPFPPPGPTASPAQFLLPAPRQCSKKSLVSLPCLWRQNPQTKELQQTFLLELPLALLGWGLARGSMPHRATKGGEQPGDARYCWWLLCQQSLGQEGTPWEDSDGIFVPDSRGTYLAAFNKWNKRK